MLGFCCILFNDGHTFFPHSFPPFPGYFSLRFFFFSLYPCLVKKLFPICEEHLALRPERVALQVRKMRVGIRILLDGGSVDGGGVCVWLLGKFPSLLVVLDLFL